MKIAFYLGLLLLFVSCNQEQKKEEQIVEKSEKSIAKKHEKVLTIEKEFQPKVYDWDEYEALKSFIEQYKNISPNDALNNSRELNGLTKSLNDSIKPKFLESPAFYARVNFLYNETLRLYDMSFISAIKTNEVNAQVDKVLQAYSSMNSKINTIILQSNLDSEVSDINFEKRRDTVPIEIAEKPKKEKPEVQLSKKEQKMKLMKEERLKKRKIQLKEKVASKKKKAVIDKEAEENKKKNEKNN